MPSSRQSARKLESESQSSLTSCPGGRLGVELACRARCPRSRPQSSFLRSFDLSERVIPEQWRSRPMKLKDSLELLLLKALDGHGWATAGTLAQTWRLRGRREQVAETLARLERAGQVEACAVVDEQGGRKRGWVRPEDLDLAARLERVRPRQDRGVLLSPFDPVLWDRQRVQQLFGFEMTLEIFKPEAQRVYGYYCLPVLAGESLVARVDLRADRKAGALRVLSTHFESNRPSATEREAARKALTSGQSRQLLDRLCAASTAVTREAS